MAKNTRKETMEAGIMDQNAKVEAQKFEQELATAVDALSTALTWKISLSTHVAVLKDGTVRKYIHVDSGLPRDVDVILVEGEGHSIVPKAFLRDKKYKETEKRQLTSTEMDYNDMIGKWFDKCNIEAKARLDVVLEDAKTWDALWGYVALMERNAEISASEKYF